MDWSLLPAHTLSDHISVHWSDVDWQCSDLRGFHLVCLYVPEMWQSWFLFHNLLQLVLESTKHLAIVIFHSQTPQNPQTKDNSWAKSLALMGAWFVICIYFSRVDPSFQVAKSQGNDLSSDTYWDVWCLLMWCTLSTKGWIGCLVSRAWSGQHFCMMSLLRCRYALTLRSWTT